MTFFVNLPRLDEVFVVAHDDRMEPVDIMQDLALNPIGLEHLHTITVP